MTKAKGIKRNEERKRNYVRGRFGSIHKKKYRTNQFERKIISSHIIPDRWLAKILRSSTNGIQAIRWRIKCNYLGNY